MTDTFSSTSAASDDTREPGTLRTIIYAVLIALVIRALAFEPFNIPSGSMIPGLQVGDYLFVSKYTYGYSSLSTTWGLLPFSGRALVAQQPERGDVIVFKLPRDNRTDYIKRLVGLPGDVVEVKHGTVSINGTALPRERIGPTMLNERAGAPPRAAIEYIETMPNGRSYHVVEEYEDAALDNSGPFQVPEGHYFMMGDNRDNSQDSRTTTVGYVPYENLVGKARFTFLSLQPDAAFYEFWKWPWSIRFDRMFQTIR